MKPIPGTELHVSCTQLFILLTELSRLIR